MRSFAILISASLLFAFVQSVAQAGAQPIDLLPKGMYHDNEFYLDNGKCYSKYGVPTEAMSYCESGVKAAPRPKVMGKGSFAGCIVQSELQMLDADESPIHILASGKIYPTPLPPGVSFTPSKLGEHWETYTINHGATRQLSARERVINVQRDSAGNIIKIQSSAYTGSTNNPNKIDLASKVYTEAWYSYPAPSHNCEVERVQSNLLQEKLLGETRVFYDRELCKTVLGIVGKNTKLNDDLAARVHRAVFARHMELTVKENRELVFSGERNEMRPMITACRNGGTPEDLQEYDQGVIKRAGGVAK